MDKGDQNVQTSSYKMNKIRDVWRKLAATAPIRPLAWEPPYATGAAQKRQKKKKKIRDVTYNMTIIITTAVCYTRKLIRVQILRVLTAREKILFHLFNVVLMR